MSNEDTPAPFFSIYLPLGTNSKSQESEIPVLNTLQSCTAVVVTCHLPGRRAPGRGLGPGPRPLLLGQLPQGSVGPRDW